MTTVHRKNNPCPNCGNEIFEKTRDYSTHDSTPAPLWKCCNCSHETKRQTRNRRSNRRIALDLWLQMKEEFSPFEQKLHDLIEQGHAKNGAILAYSSTFNYAIGQMLDVDNPTRQNIKVWESMAREDLQKLADFIAKITPENETA